MNFLQEKAKKHAWINNSRLPSLDNSRKVTRVTLHQASASEVNGVKGLHV